MSCFGKMSVANEEERHARMKSVGIICKYYTSLHEHMSFLEEQVRYAPHQLIASGCSKCVLCHVLEPIFRLSYKFLMLVISQNIRFFTSLAVYIMPRKELQKLPKTSKDYFSSIILCVSLNFELSLDHHVF